MITTAWGAFWAIIVLSCGVYLMSTAEELDRALVGFLIILIEFVGMARWLYLMGMAS